MQQARVRLAGTSPEDLDAICTDVRDIAENTGVNLSGPVPLPTKELGIPARKSPDGEGTATWEHWEMRVHKRLIDLDADERALRQLMRIQVPNDVSIEIVLED
ncbi:30S ribosomal protein S10 [Halobacteriales archaeon QS_3_64_16]|jgi:small subunit ribosomal protein S10|nr:MAG: 30S ribosomal protein S10 [Halobacteriales archaeon QH_8_64_26]PSP72903.1 MAG: 30S ribosomal protein S10 [Halobacteriales archaeon QS_3_64_16]